MIEELIEIQEENTEEEISIEEENTENKVSVEEESVTIVNGTNNYETLRNKPQINSIELIGNKSFTDLDINKITNTEIEQIFTF